jgi:hypothetical protein
MTTALLPMPSILRRNLKFRASSVKSGNSLSLDFYPLRPISGVSQHRIFLTVFFVPSQQIGMHFVSEQTFQPWYYRIIPHHLGKNPLLGALAINIASVISPDLIPQCTAYRACIQILVLLTAVENASCIFYTSNP